MPMTDDSKLTFGMHAGKPLSEVPDKYLLWLYENNKAHGDLKLYIIDNLDSIKHNAAK
jgi:uncharacterized protein (DUF3820 family)